MPEQTTPVSPPLTRLEAHQRKQAEAKQHRQAASTDKHLNYSAIQQHPAMLDLLQTAKSFALYHEHIARDGVGMTNQEVVHLNHERRVTELDKAAGLHELINYIERQFINPDEQPSPEPTVG